MICMLIAISKGKEVQLVWKLVKVVLLLYTLCEADIHYSAKSIVVPESPPAQTLDLAFEVFQWDDRKASDQMQPIS